MLGIKNRRGGSVKVVFKSETVRAVHLCSGYVYPAPFHISPANAKISKKMKCQIVVPPRPVCV